MHHAQLPGLTFTAIDFETANQKRASVCAVGVVKVRDGVVVDAFDTLVQPPPGFGEFHHINVGVHGITARDVVGAPTWDVVQPKLTEFVDGDVLVAHNAPFDRSVLEQASAAHGIGMARSPWLCTLAAARSMLDLPSYKLPAVAAALGLDPHAHHDAGADARQCALVLVELCRGSGMSGADLMRRLAR